MKNSLIFNITNDSITIAAGKHFKGKPVLLSVNSREYDGLLDFKNKAFDANFIYKQIKLQLEEMFKKLPPFDEVYVVIPDINIDSYITSIIVYTSNESSIVSDTDINFLFSSANKKYIDERKNKIISVSPIYFETDKQRFTKAPIGEESSLVKMVYSCYPIDNKFHEILTKIFNKLGFKDIKLTYNSVELANAIRTSYNYPKNYFMFDSGYTNSYYSIVGEHVISYCENIGISLFTLLDDFVHEYDIPYSDARNMIYNYGYDAVKHPMKVLIYESKNSMGVDVKIYQSDLNERIEKFIFKLTEIINEKEKILRNLLKVSEDIKLPVISIGELFDINGFTEKFIEISGRQLISFENKFSFHKTRNIYPIIGVLNKVEEYDFKKAVTKENISTVTRGE
jgi:cell division ATPase FtsA